MIIAQNDILQELNDYCKELDKEHKIMRLRVIREWAMIERIAKGA